MNKDEIFCNYCTLAARTLARPHNNNNMDLAHAVIGVNTEIGELYELLAKEDESGYPDNVNFKEEIGDCFWYVGVYFYVSKDALALHEFNEAAASQLDSVQFKATVERMRDLGYGLLDAVKKYLFYGKALDQAFLSEGFRQISLDLVLLAHSRGFQLFDILDANVRKLRARYPGAFTEENAVNRDLAAERKALLAPFQSPSPKKP